MTRMFLLFGLVWSFACALLERDECLGAQSFITLNNGVSMPKLGFGLAGMKGDLTKFVVREHLLRGFRLLDGAEATEWYDDEAAGSEIKNLPFVNRNQIFIVTKIHPKHLSYQATRKAVEASLLRWNQTSYLDAVLLHYPACGSWIPHCGKTRGGDWKGAYKALEDLYQEGVIRAIGVSNFNLHELEALVAMTQTVHVIQDWIDPFHQNRELLDWARARGIAVMAYSSFGTQWEGRAKKNLVWESEVLRDIARVRNTTVTGVVLAWLLEDLNVVAIPRSTQTAHIEENAQWLSADYSSGRLLEEDFRAIAELDNVFDMESRETCAKIVRDQKCHVRKKECQATCRGKNW